MTSSIAAAQARAGGLLERPWAGRDPEAPAASPVRWFGMGDPQAPFQKVLGVLEHHGLLGEDGWLVPGAGLLSIGDHFDWAGDAAEVGRSGETCLRWLAGHDPRHVVLIAGNHDLNRVQEFAGESDARFAEARALAVRIESARRDAAGGESVRALEEEFHRRFAPIPTPGLAARDCLSWSERQRALVRRLLTGGRFLLGCAARAEDGTPLLFTHASITTRELELLGIAGERGARAIAAALRAFFSERIAAADSEWRAGALTPLNLAPIHYHGQSGQEGGGFLYHRPMNPESPHGGISGPARREAARRYDPRSVLPRGLLQACGHSAHRKCLRVLGDWTTESARARARGGLRTLRTDGRSVTYDMGVHTAVEGEATLHMIDGEMGAVETETYALYPFAGPVFED